MLDNLLGIESAEHLQSHAIRGSLFEGFILTEIIKYYTARGSVAPLYFWRNQQGLEIDALIEKSDKLLSFEVKSGMTFHSEFLQGLTKWQQLSGEPPEHSHLLYTGNQAFSQRGMQILPWNQFSLETILS